MLMVVAVGIDLRVAVRIRVGWCCDPTGRVDERADSVIGIGADDSPRSAGSLTVSRPGESGSFIGAAAGPSGDCGARPWRLDRRGKLAPWSVLENLPEMEVLKPRPWGLNRRRKLAPRSAEWSPEWNDNASALKP